MNNERSEIENLGKAYLYVLYNGKVEEYDGEIVKLVRYGYSGQITQEKGIFMISKENGKRIKGKRLCSVDEKIAYSSAVWLYEKNIKKAIDIFSDYKRTQIEELKFQIQYHQEILEHLKQQIES